MAVHKEKNSEPDEKTHHESHPHQESAEPKRKQSEVLMSQIQTILASHNGKESDIGVTDSYWDMLNEYRRLVGLGL